MSLAGLETYNVAIAEDHFKLRILLPPPLKCWLYRYIPPHPVYITQGALNSRLHACYVSVLPTEPYAQPPPQVFFKNGFLQLCTVAVS